MKGNSRHCWGQTDLRLAPFRFLDSTRWRRHWVVAGNFKQVRRWRASALPRGDAHDGLGSVLSIIRDSVSMGTTPQFTLPPSSTRERRARGVTRSRCQPAGVTRRDILGFLAQINASACEVAIDPRQVETRGIAPGY